MKNLYHLDITDHAQSPRNFGIPEQVDFRSALNNPSCGDEVIMAGTLQNGVITQLWFEGKGCSLSLAMASKLTEYAKNAAVADAFAYDATLVEKLLGMPLGPRRMLCGMLCVQALQTGLKTL